MGKTLAVFLITCIVLIGCEAAVDDHDMDSISDNPDEHYSVTETKDLAKKGDPMGQFNLGLLYYYGDSDVPQDYRKALEWFNKSAKKGFSNAPIYIGLMYENGQGVRQDYIEAAKWYLKSAKQNEPEAQRFLGVMYINGQGVRQDYTEAKEWFGKSCDNGYQESCDDYRRLNEHGY